MSLDTILDIGLPIVAAIAQALTAYWGFNLAVKTPTKKSRHYYRLGFALAGVLGVFCVGAIAARQHAEQTKSQYDFAYLVLDQSAPVIDGNTTFFLLASDNLDQLYFSWSKTSDYADPKIPKFLTIFPLVRYGRQDRVLLPIGDWTFDIDAKGHHAKIRQRLVVANEDGNAVVKLSHVCRKDQSNETICELPAQKGAPVCP